MLKSKVWFSDGQPSPAVGVIETDAVSFRVTDSKPVIQPPAPSQTRKPTCHGDPMFAGRLWEPLYGRL